MVVPTCNFYHFLVSFASQARPEDIHKERAKETERKWRWGGETLPGLKQRGREKRLRNRGAKGGKMGGNVIGEPI